MESSLTTLDSNLKQLKVIFWALLLGQMAIFTAFKYLLGKSSGTADLNMEYLKYIIPVAAVSLILMGRFLFSQRLQQIGSETDETSRWNQYRAAVIVRMALTEGASLICIVIGYVSKESWLLDMALLIIVYFNFLNPKRDTVIRDMNIMS